MCHSPSPSSLGDLPGGWLYGALRGVDDRPVEDKGPPRSISVEGNNPMQARSYADVEQILSGKASELAERIHEDVSTASLSLSSRMTVSCSLLACMFIRVHAVTINHACLFPYSMRCMIACRKRWSSSSSSLEVLLVA